MPQKIIAAEDPGTKKLRDLFGILGMAILLIHFYDYGQPAFMHWGLASEIARRIDHKFLQISALNSYWKIKSLCLAAAAANALWVRPNHRQNPGWFWLFVRVITGSALYFFSREIFLLEMYTFTLALLYMLVTLAGFLLFLSGFAAIVRRLRNKFLQREFFNTRNETFPQEERLIENEYSINLPAVYDLRGKQRRSWINITNPFRGLLVLGTPGSGKTFFIIREVIRQHIQKGFAMLIYDFKYPDLTTLAYNEWLTYRDAYPVRPEFYVIDFEEITYRCNPVDPGSLNDVTDAAESARTILLGLNPAWIKKQGDFWVESSINFLTALLWFLKLYQGGRFCTLAHTIELIQIPYDKLFSILQAEPQVGSLIMPFVTAYTNNASAQLEGQVAGTTISLGKLSSPGLYYVLSGNDFTLDINNPKSPKIVCLGNRPQKANIYGAVLSLYITELTRRLNKRNMAKTSIIFDEFPSIYCNGMDNLLATARSNRVAATLAVQDASQLKLHYGKEQAEVILNIPGNIISGQVTGETAKQLAERFGRIIQDKQSVSVREGENAAVTSSTQLDMAIPQSTIASLSSGEFVGMVADDPAQKMKLKKFHCQIVPQDLRKREAKRPPPVELPHPTISQQTILDNYLQIKRDIQLLVETEMEKIMEDPSLKNLIVVKK
jgi:hypothetical protein